jgi:hypothetical protein
VWQPSTFNRYAYVSNNPINYIDPAGLQDEGPFEPKFGGPYVPLEDRIRDHRVGGEWGYLDPRLWLEAAVERDPLVHHVYKALRRSLENRYYERDAFRRELVGTDPGRLPAIEFLCEAIKEARVNMARYAPGVCGDADGSNCNKLTVRIGLNALAATVQWVANQISPDIMFENEKARLSQGRRHAREDAMPEIRWRSIGGTLEWQDPPLNPRLRQGGRRDEYSGEDADRWEKTYHFFTSAFMSYEMRWAGIPSPLAYRVTDWAGRYYEWDTERQGGLPYSWNDVVANRWGALFGITYFNDPDRLVSACVGECKTP